MAKVKKVGYFWVVLLPDKQPDWMNIPIKTPMIAKWAEDECWYFTGVEMGFAHHCVQVLSKCLVVPGTKNHE